MQARLFFHGIEKRKHSRSVVAKKHPRPNPKLYLFASGTG